MFRIEWRFIDEQDETNPESRWKMEGRHFNSKKKAIDAIWEEVNSSPAQIEFRVVRYEVVWTP